MKNQFEKENHIGLIVSVAIAAATAAGLAYLFLTEKGNRARNHIKKQFKDKATDLAAIAISGRTGIKKKTVKKVADHLIK